MEIVKTYKLFLDDIRSLKDAYSYTNYLSFIKDDWIIVRNYDAFKEFINDAYRENNAFPDMIAFDHDLADEHYGAPTTSIFQEKTGMDCAHWLVDFCMDNNLTLPNWVCHSMNPAGRENIDTYLLNYRKHEKNN